MGDEGITFLDFIRKVHQEKRERERFIIKGGKGSGWFAPPKGTHGKGRRGPTIQVGITSFKSEKGQGLKQLKRDMAELKRDLGKTDIKDLSVVLGTGGWEGGGEPTFITLFKGDGKARRVLAGKAKKWDQDAVIIMQRVSKGGQPQTRISFGEALTKEEYGTIEKGLLAASKRHGAGIGGWTWGRGASGHPELIAQCIPQWGGNSKGHVKASQDLLKRLQGLGYDVSLDQLQVKVEVWEKEAGDYDRILGERTS